MTMRLAAVLTVFTTLVCLPPSETTAVAASPTASTAATRELVRYRLTDWRAVHTSNEGQAKKLAATLTKLRCQVEQSSHGNHIDVRYRCKDWQELELKDHATAHQWEAWLKKYGFQTVHQH